MAFFGYAVLFFLSGFAQYLLTVDRGNQFGLFLMIALPVAGVYFLGWWALLICIGGAYFGARVFFASIKANRGGLEE
jgi:hypothetical protein